MNIKMPLKFNTLYDFQCINIKTGKKIHAQTHNLITNKFFTDAPSSILGFNIVLGKGTGTPAVTDTGCFSALWTINNDKHSYEFFEEECKYVFHLHYTVPASTSYVGKVTECALGSGCTHALIKDAEGAPMSIDKTDLDKLLIDVTIEITINDNSSVLHTPLKTSQLHYALVGNSPFSRLFVPGMQYLFSPDSAIYNGVITRNDTYYDGTHADATASITYEGSTSSALRNHRSAGKLSSSWPVAGQHYINGILLSDFYIIKFPNEEVFPLYQITEIPVGVGDDATTDYHCPLNLFAEGTEEIFIDGVLQTRGTDYTIEAYNNADGLPELMASNFGKITGGTNDGSTPKIPIFRAVLNEGMQYCYYTTTYAYSAGGTTSTAPGYFTTNDPLFFDLFNNMKVNTFIIGAGYNAGANYVYTLWYSNDNTQWEKAAEMNHTSNTKQVVKFDTIEARYWKVTIHDKNNASANLSSGSSMGYAYSYYGHQPTAIDTNRLCLFGYIGGGIHFNTPPARDAIITMNAYIDRPLKTDSLIVECNANLTF